MLQGLSLSLVVGIVALALSTFIPLGAVVLAIVIGMILSNLLKIPKSFGSGISYAEKSILAFAIATLGINLDFSVLAQLGFSTILIIIVGMIITIYSTLFLARFFKIDKNFALILGIGNGVCGASAIGATKNIIKVDSDQAGIAVGVVNLLGTIGMFLVPFIAIIIGLNETQAGILVGNTLQAVGQAVAGGFAINQIAGESATVVKMGRVLLLTPIIVILLMVYHQKSQKEKTPLLKNIPPFIYWFIGFSFIATFGLLSQDIENSIALISKYALIVAMAGIGLKISFSSIKENGKSALLLGSVVFSIQIIVSLILILVL